MRASQEGKSTRKVVGFESHSVAQRALGLAAILWFAAGALAHQRPIRTVQTEARMIQMAGEAVARRQEKKKQDGETQVATAPLAGPAESRRPVVKIVVSILDRKLALIEDDRVVKIYPVAVGAASTPSPQGEFRIASRLENPSWYWPGKVIPAGAANPLGPRWIGLGVRGFGIHGTNEPQTIGRSASHGCIRMRNRDVKDLFRRVRAGDAVEIRGERDETLAAIFSAPQGDAGARATLKTAASRRSLDANLATSGANGTVSE